RDASLCPPPPSSNVFPVTVGILTTILQDDSHRLVRVSSGVWRGVLCTRPPNRRLLRRPADAFYYLGRGLSSIYPEEQYILNPPPSPIFGRDAPLFLSRRETRTGATDGLAWMTPLVSTLCNGLGLLLSASGDFGGFLPAPFPLYPPYPFPPLLILFTVILSFQNPLNCTVRPSSAFAIAGLLCVLCPAAYLLNMRCTIAGMSIGRGDRSASPNLPSSPPRAPRLRSAPSHSCRRDAHPAHPRLRLSPPTSAVSL
ncbi:hypothetical protein B0H14DRAFT_3603365, partial [Mycena olivaceomarginata]